MKDFGKEYGLILSSFLFSVGWFSIAFSLPLLGVRYGFTSAEIGLLGSGGALPFVIFPYVLRNYTPESALRLLRIPPIVVAIGSILLIPYSPSLFILGLAIVDLLQGLYWIVIEIYIGYLDREGGAEKYSFSWGIPNFVMPIAMGFLVNAYGFLPLFVVGSVACLGSFFVTPKVHFPNVRKATGKPEVKFVFPMLFVGNSSGYLFYVIIPHLRSVGVEYSALGILSSIPSLVIALGFFFLILLRSTSIWKSALISSLFLASPILLIFYHGLMEIAAISAVAGLGSAIGFSKVLAYVSKSTSPSYGVMYYEGFFAAGFTVGSLGGGFLFGLLSYGSSIVIFALPVLYSIIMVLNSSRWISGSRL